MAEVMCPACSMGKCEFCTLMNCSCNDMPTDDISKQIHEKRRKVDNYKRISEGADLEQ